MNAVAEHSSLGSSSPLNLTAVNPVISNAPVLIVVIWDGIEIVVNPVDLKEFSPIVNVASLLPSQELQSKVSEDTNNVEVKGGGRGKKLSDDIKIAVAMDLETGDYTYAQLCEKYDISYASVSRIKKEMIGGDMRKQNKKRHSGKRKSSNKFNTEKR